MATVKVHGLRAAWRALPSICLALASTACAVGGDDVDRRKNSDLAPWVKDGVPRVFGSDVFQDATLGLTLHFLWRERGEGGVSPTSEREMNVIAEHLLRVLKKRLHGVAVANTGSQDAWAPYGDRAKKLRLRVEVLGGDGSPEFLPGRALREGFADKLHVPFGPTVQVLEDADGWLPQTKYFLEMLAPEAHGGPLFLRHDPGTPLFETLESGARPASQSSTNGFPTRHYMPVALHFEAGTADERVAVATAAGFLAFDRGTQALRLPTQFPMPERLETDREWILRRAKLLPYLGRLQVSAYTEGYRTAGWDLSDAVDAFRSHVQGKTFQVPAPSGHWLFASDVGTVELRVSPTVLDIDQTAFSREDGRIGMPRVAVVFHGLRGSQVEKLLDAVDDMRPLMGGLDLRALRSADWYKQREIERAGQGFVDAAKCNAQLRFAMVDVHRDYSVLTDAHALRRSVLNARQRGETIYNLLGTVGRLTDAHSTLRASQLRRLEDFETKQAATFSVHDESDDQESDAQKPGAEESSTQETRGIATWSSRGDQELSMFEMAEDVLRPINGPNFISLFDFKMEQDPYYPGGSAGVYYRMGPRPSIEFRFGKVVQDGKEPSEDATQEMLDPSSVTSYVRSAIQASFLATDVP